MTVKSVKTKKKKKIKDVKNISFYDVKKPLFYSRLSRYITSNDCGIDSVTSCVNFGCLIVNV